MQNKPAPCCGRHYIPMSVNELKAMSDHDLLIRVATKLEELTGNGQPGRCSSHGSRIRRLELWRSWLAGAGLAQLSELANLPMVTPGVLLGLGKRKGASRHTFLANRGL